MKKILAFGGSNSSKSINQQFALYIANQIENAQITTFDLSEMPLPLFSVDIEEEEGIPDHIRTFKTRIDEADGIILSLAEHNGLPTAAFKNLWDWTSRLDKNFWANKPILLASTSPGKRGGANVLKTINGIIPFFAGNVKATFSLPQFWNNFKEGELIDTELKASLLKQLQLLEEAL